MGRIRPLNMELLALEWRKFHTFELQYLWSQLAKLDQILCVASLGWGKSCIRFWGRLTLEHWTQVSDRCPLGYLLAYLSRSLTRWAYSIPMVRRPSVVRRRPHFQTWISLTPVGQSWSNFMCSITWGGERLHNVSRQIGWKLWCPWQQKSPIEL